MVPGSTFRYGSHFCRVTLKPRLSRRQPMEEAATPLPSEETTPPVTNIYFGAIRVVRASTTPAWTVHTSQACGRPQAVGFRSVSTNLSTMTTYTQLWARDPALSIATLAVDQCKFLILAETFSAQKGSKFHEDPSRPGIHDTADDSGTRFSITPRPSNIGKSVPSLFNPASGAGHSWSVQTMNLRTGGGV